ESMMIRAKDLQGRAVVDVGTAKKLGTVDEVLLDPRGRQIAGLVVSEGGSLLGGQHHLIVPAAALRRLSKLLGRKVVTQGGKLLGSLDDVLVEGANGRISGYALGAPPNPAEVVEGWFGGGRSEARYVRADTDIRVGEDLIVVPDNAMVEGEPPDDARAAGVAGRAPGRDPAAAERTRVPQEQAAHDYAEADRLLRSSTAEEAGSRPAPRR